MKFSKKTLTSNFGIGLLLVLAIFLGQLKYKQYRSQLQIEQQTKNLEQQVDAQQKQTDELSQTLKYLNSSSFTERVARQQLNFKKQGEVVYGFTDATNASQPGQSGQSTDPNAKKWWNYFFGI